MDGEDVWKRRESERIDKHGKDLKGLKRNSSFYIPASSASMSSWI